MSPPEFGGMGLRTEVVRATSDNLSYTPRHMALSRSAPLALISSLALGCIVNISDGDDDTDTATGGPTVTASDSAGSTTEQPTTDPGTNSNATTDDTSVDGSGSSGDEDTTSGDHTDCDFTEDFEGLADGDPWPSEWIIDGGVAAADIRGGRGRLQAEISSYSLARISVRLDCTDVDASVTFSFTDGGTQGAALYARTNGGYLQETNPVGEGYAAFAELFRNPGALGVWREVGGQEQQISDTAFELSAGVEYRMRFRLTQTDASRSLLQTKIWRLDGEEPAEWMVEQSDDTASLQGAGGGIALDAWSSDPITGGAGADLYFDDLVVTRAQ